MHLFMINHARILISCKSTFLHPVIWCSIHWATTKWVAKTLANMITCTLILWNNNFCIGFCECDLLQFVIYVAAKSKEIVSLQIAAWRNRWKKLWNAETFKAVLVGAQQEVKPENQKEYYETLHGLYFLFREHAKKSKRFHVGYMPMRWETLYTKLCMLK